MLREEARKSTKIPFGIKKGFLTFDLSYDDDFFQPKATVGYDNKSEVNGVIRFYVLTSEEFVVVVDKSHVNTSRQQHG